MLNVIVWIIVIELIGLAIFPICFYLLPQLKDRGYSVSKIFGLVVLGYLSWILSVSHILPSTQITAWALLLLIVGLAGWLFWTRRQMYRRFFTEHYRVILIAESVFLAMFLLWVLFRSYDPAINHTEQPMDFAFLNASVRTHLGAPEDPWLRGESISYYYFGYWMMGILTELTRIPSYVSYNLSLALIPALAAMAVFGLVYNMVSTESMRMRYGIFSGVMAALLLVMAANLEGFLEFLRANAMGSGNFWDWVDIEGLKEPLPDLTDTWRPVEWLWWWRATRVIGTHEAGEAVDYTIHEFPAFSFILGDLHPHVMSIPFVMLYLTMCWNFLRSPFSSWKIVNAQTCLQLFALVFVLGALAFINAWDLPVFWALLVGVTALKIYSKSNANVWEIITGCAFVGLAALATVAIFYLPYFLNISSTISGIGVVEHTSRPFHFLVVWSLLFVVVFPLVIGLFLKTTVNHNWTQLTMISALVGFAPYLIWAFMYIESGGSVANLPGRFFHVLPLSILVGMSVYSALWFSREGKNSDAKVFSMTLSALGLFIIIGPELLFVDDSFGGAQSRMNTVFKLYYQGWMLFAVCGGYGLYYWQFLRDNTTGWRLRTIRMSTGVFVFLLACSAYYSLAAAVTKAELFHGDRNLDGLNFIRQVDSAEYKAINLIQKSARRHSGVLEAVGEDYSEFGRVSSSTGVPTIIGWIGHQSQWRGSVELYEGRDLDVRTLYETQDVGEAKVLLAKYKIDFVYVGSREIGKYGTQGLAKFPEFMDTIFYQDGVTVYKTRP